MDIISWILYYEYTEYLPMLSITIKAGISLSNWKNASRKPEDLTDEELKKCCEDYRHEIRKCIAWLIRFAIFVLLCLCRILPYFLLIPVPILLFVVQFKFLSICCPICGYGTVMSRAGGIYGLVNSECPRCGFSLAKYDEKSRFH